jgi:hypothetical protein
VAGIVANTDAGSPGVATGVDLVVLRVFDDAGRGDFLWVEEALRWVHQHRNDFEHPITTVSLSIGSDWNSDSPPPWAMLEEELAQLEADGIFVSAAAGNAFTDYQKSGLTYPAASSHVVPASSVDADGSLCYFSQRHDRAIAAPGRAIRSTVPDYVGNGNGVSDDFARYSGTSMAAPYVAGASVLLREAYQFAGTADVTPDLVYSTMRSTAEVIYDEATGDYYRRLNLQAALDAIMPADDFGSTSQSAYDLGTLLDSQSLEGAIGRTTDQDFFQFTADHTGQVTLSIETTHDLAADWQLVGGQIASADHAGMTFSVAEGDTYVVGLGTIDGIGHYTIDVRLEEPASDESATQERQWQSLDQEISPQGQWIPLRAVDRGILTVEASFSHDDGDVDLQLFDSAGRLIGGSYSIEGRERIDVPASAGEQFSVYAYVAGSGVNDDVDFQFTNMVSQVDDAVYVWGSGGDDVFTFAAGGLHEVTINGVSYEFDAATVRQIHFDGLAGSDAATLTGTSSAETAIVRVGAAEVAGDDYQVDAVGLSSVTVVGRGGKDTAYFYDSTGDDVLHATPRQATLSGPGYQNKAIGFEQVHAYAKSGGLDIARLIGSRGDDVLVGTPTYGKLFGDNFLRRANYFDAVHAKAGSGGFDVAKFYDSAGDDQFVGRPAFARVAGESFAVRAKSFDKVTAWARAGGYDTAYLHGTGDDDHCRSGCDEASLWGQGFFNRAKAFEETHAEGFSAHAETGGASQTTGQERVEAAWLLVPPYQAAGPSRPASDHLSAQGVHDDKDDDRSAEATDILFALNDHA